MDAVLSGSALPFRLTSPPAPRIRPDPPTSVHPPESTSPPRHALDPLDQDSQAYAFRHASWAPTRARVHRALAQLVPCPEVKYDRLARFEDCGRRAWLMRSASDPCKMKFVLDNCHDRFCMPCGRHRATVISENLNRQLGQDPHRFLTLTLKHSATSLAAQLDRLFDAFKRLRNRTFWKERVTGGALFFEVTWNAEDLRWHPHLHVILAGSYVPKAMLRLAWQEITGDSAIVDIKIIRDRRHVVSYACKYATKPLHPTVIRDHDALTECLLAIADRKLISCFGAWARWALLEEVSDGTWTLYCHVDAALSGCNVDLHALRQIQAAWNAYVTGTGPPTFTLDRPPPDD